MSDIRLRKAGPADVRELSALPRPGEAAAAGYDRMSRYLAGTHHPQKALPPRVILVAERGEAPIGYAAGHLTRRFGCDGELQWIYVVPQHRRTQVASRLLVELARWFADHKAKRVCVDIGDDASRPFYRRHGAGDLQPSWMVWEDITEILPPWAESEK